MQTSPLTKIIFLSGILSTGFLLIILSGSLYNNWYPLYVVLVFLLAPLPNLIVHGGSNDSYDDFLGSNYNNSSNGAGDFAKFITGMFVSSGVLIPIVFNHCGLIKDMAIVDFVCRDTNLGTKPITEPISETGGTVPVNTGGVHGFQELISSVFVVCDNNVCVLGTMSVDMLDSRVDIFGETNSNVKRKELLVEIAFDGWDNLGRWDQRGCKDLSD
ncbi:hypothetical protein WICPIJ_003612 [Wickerhamomyces pijperi]|uniref:Uncharacterized protein n=1 Tax=Wickerhamomyces pijperi TaxID=599730 RepID=A0A9P8Q7B0_WICPI|nr:hypothetical protein WICPIJ_003612 [Wickerhamomyces pijperi]